MRCADYVTDHGAPLDGQLFAIKNLIHIKNLVLVYEIAGSHRASVLDFTDLWATFADLRARGGLFDIGAYYKLVRTGTLFPKVVENVQDARIELDGLLRKSITMFRERCVKMLVRAANGDPENQNEAARRIKEKLVTAFPFEGNVRENLWEAVQVVYAEEAGERLEDIFPIG
jgi:hypothetical protein